MHSAYRPRVVLFVCVGNACRSPMAEAIARSDHSDIISPLSAGIAPLGFVVESTKQTLVANGYETAGLSSKALSEELWSAAEIVINMTGRRLDAAFRGFPEHPSVEEWAVKDPYGAETGLYQQVCEELQGRVSALAMRLREAAALLEQKS